TAVDKPFLQLCKIRWRKEDEQCLREFFPDLFCTFDFNFQEYIMSIRHCLLHIFYRGPVVIADILGILDKLVLFDERLELFLCLKEIEIGRASCRERVSISVVALALKTKQTIDAHSST